MSLRNFIFGSEAMAPIQKDGARAEAGAPKVEAMLNMISRAGERHDIGADLVFSAADVAATRRAESWLDSRINAARAGQCTEPKPVSITPATAEVMLRHNDGNRELRQRTVQKYRAAIREGRWRVTHQGVAFDRAGVLRDGQHRLMAIAAEGRAVEMVVTFGLDPAAFAVLDTHAGRKASDVLQINGHGGRDLAAAARALLGIRSSAPRGEYSFDHDVIDDFVAGHPGFVEFHQRINGVRASLKTGVGFNAGMFEVREAASAVKFEQFIEQVRTGIGFASKNDAANVLRTALLSGTFRRRGPSTVAEAVILAWNAWSQGRTLRKMTVGVGPFPVAARA